MIYYFKRTNLGGGEGDKHSKLVCLFVQASVFVQASKLRIYNVL
jgi:hypothetical protein